MRELRQSQLQQICTGRRITTLIHFTRIENLSSTILQEGLLSRSLLERRNQPFLFNDEQRLDGHTEAICLSINFPNYKMFSKYRRMTRDSDWAVLLLDAKVLWELDCAFYQANAASSTADITPSLEQRRESDALESMFVEDYANRQDLRISRQDLKIPDNYPTNPQAEVLVLDSIPVKYISVVHSWKAADLEKWRSGNRTTYLPMFAPDPYFFNPRRDWHHWMED